MTGGFIWQGTTDGQILRMTAQGPTWGAIDLSNGDVSGTVFPVGALPVAAAETRQPEPCSFCGKPTLQPKAKHDWHVCTDKHCTAAAEVQSERIYACLVDCPETRASALAWVRAR